jgi:hypothetical protein
MEMKTDRARGSEDGPEREALRAFLRHWPVPGPPPDLEEDLRRTFRRRQRQPSRRPVVWLAVAAGLAFLALWRVMPAGRPVPPGRTAITASPPPAPSVPLASKPTVSRTRIAAAPAQADRVRQAAVTAQSEPEVIVEPGQAELLVQLGRELQLMRPAEPATTLPRIETVPADAPEAPIPEMHAAGAPPYRVEWQTVAGEWPFIHRSVPGSGR